MHPQCVLPIRSRLRIGRSDSIPIGDLAGSPNTCGWRSNSAPVALQRAALQFAWRQRIFRHDCSLAPTINIPEFAAMPHRKRPLPHVRNLMSEISRRDFLNGFALTVAGSLTPEAQIAAQPMRYPPALTGMRGHHPGSFEVGHGLRDGETFPFGQTPMRRTTIWSWSAAASAGWRRPGSIGAPSGTAPHHDPRQSRRFGGHANSKIAKFLLNELGVDIARFETAFERGFILRSGSRAAYSFRARHSGATPLSPAIR